MLGGAVGAHVADIEREVASFDGRTEVHADHSRVARPLGVREHRAQQSRCRYAAEWAYERPVGIRRPPRQRSSPAFHIRRCIEGVTGSCRFNHDPHLVPTGPNGMLRRRRCAVDYLGRRCAIRFSLLKRAQPRRWINWLKGASFAAVACQLEIVVGSAGRHSGSSDAARSGAPGAEATALHQRRRDVRSRSASTTSPAWWMWKRRCGSACGGRAHPGCDWMAFI